MVSDRLFYRFYGYEETELSLGTCKTTVCLLQLFSFYELAKKQIHPSRGGRPPVSLLSRNKKGFVH